ncbi:MAG: hypothetical protein WCK90_04565 [archaeon]
MAWSIWELFFPDIILKEVDLSSRNMLVSIPYNLVCDSPNLYADE